MHELPEAHPTVVETQIQEWAEEILRRVRNPDLRAVLAHGHALLFDELAFAGATDDYHNPHNSYLPIVVEQRRGIPITLSLVYREVMRRCGLEVRGVNTPGHFLCAVRDEGGRWQWIDAFAQGRMLSDADVAARVAEMAGMVVMPGDHLAPTATPTQWLRRMLRNLELIFQEQENETHRLLELAGLLDAD